MKHSTRIAFLFILFICQNGLAQTWVDTLDSYARNKYLPAHAYIWNWQNAALLNTMVKEYNLKPSAERQVYFNYIKKAMDHTYWMANGKTPNSVASGLGMAFLYRVTKEEKYKKKCEKIFSDYQKIRRTKDGGVSHLLLFTELWDDTIFMIGQFLLSMYQATGDEKYIDELVKQIKLHREKLQDPKTGLWYHGWDSDNKTHCTFCSEMYWADKTTRQSTEFWGRGNGWIIVTLSDALEVIPRDNKHWNELADCLKQMIVNLPEAQDKTTGHWYQLPLRTNDSLNFIESSCTAMFAYGINKAVNLGIVSGDNYKLCLSRAYYGLRKYSLVPAAKNYLIPQNICSATCIGHKKYYLKRKIRKGTPYGIGMFIQFGELYEMDNGLRAKNNSN